MTAELIPLIILFAVGACGWVLAWRYMREIERLTGQHAAGRVRAARRSAARTLLIWCLRLHARLVPDYGRHSDIPAPARPVEPATSPLLALPAARPPYPSADQRVTRAEVNGHPEWQTAGQAALTPEVEAEMEAKADLARRMRQKEVTSEDMRQVYDQYFGRHARHDDRAALDNVTSWDPAQLTYGQLTYGQQSVAGVLAAEAEAGAQQAAGYLA